MWVWGVFVWVGGVILCLWTKVQVVRELRISLGQCVLSPGYQTRIAGSVLPQWIFMLCVYVRRPSVLEMWRCAFSKLTRNSSRMFFSFSRNCYNKDFYQVFENTRVWGQRVEPSGSLMFTTVWKKILCVKVGSSIFMLLNAHCCVWDVWLKAGTFHICPVSVCSVFMCTF